MLAKPLIFDAFGVVFTKQNGRKEFFSHNTFDFFFSGSLESLQILHYRSKVQE